MIDFKYKIKNLNSINFNTDTELCEIMQRNKSDKHSLVHNYTKVYSFLFNEIKDKSINLFELGIGTNKPHLPSNMGINGTPGASLRGWRDYFINAQIFGADIDLDILIDEERIKTFYVDQKNPAVIRSLFDNDLKNVEFDIIVDDGLHEFEANRDLILNSIHKLKKGGIHITEDLNCITRDQFKSLLNDSFLNNLNIRYAEIFTLPFEGNSRDNTLLFLIK